MFFHWYSNTLNKNEEKYSMFVEIINYKNMLNIIAKTHNQNTKKHFHNINQLV